MKNNRCLVAIVVSRASQQLIKVLWLPLLCEFFSSSSSLSLSPFRFSFVFEVNIHLCAREGSKESQLHFNTSSIMVVAWSMPSHIYKCLAKMFYINKRQRTKPLRIASIDSSVSSSRVRLVSVPEYENEWHCRMHWINVRW